MEINIGKLTKVYSIAHLQGTFKRYLQVSTLNSCFNNNYDSYFAKNKVISLFSASTFSFIIYRLKYRVINFREVVQLMALSCKRTVYLGQVLDIVLSLNFNLVEHWVSKVSGLWSHWMPGLWTQLLLKS